ncbi:Yip1-like protein [Rhodovulum marinum]|uniref:Yip1-like protein n=2 Tax=Rhodovulum marinum TaxID=320662 RepID=A0A4R2PZN7_9RHOB|nr:Yip1-like protein [Rhodovulum marinum]
MPHSFPSLIALARETLSNPRGGARAVLSLGLPEGVLWQMLVAIVSISVLLTQLGEYLVPAPMDPLTPVFRANPLLTAVVQGGLLVVTVYAIHVIGRRFGGRGDFAGALALTVWLQALMVGLQVVQTLFLVALPPVAGLVGLFGIGLFFWLLSHFVAELHGFFSAIKTFAAIIASMVAIILGMSLFMSILGITFGGALSDV